MAAQELFTTSLFNDANLKSYYRLESDGTDSKGSITLSSNGTPSFSTGEFGNAVSSTSNGQLQNTTSCPLTYVDFGSAWSISYWFNRASTSGNVMCFLIASSAILSRRRDTYIDFNGAGANVVVHTEYPATTITGATTISLNTWYHCAATFDGTTMTLYINGISDGTALPPYNQNITNTSSSTAVAGYYDGTSTVNNWDGLIDDFAVFNRALTSTEVSQLYNGFSKPLLPLLGIGT